jgi:hypothetical protein
MTNSKNTIPRRARRDLCEPAEIAIYDAMQAVEKMPADLLLTEAIIKLGQAKDLVSDFVDLKNAHDGK